MLGEDKLVVALNVGDKAQKIELAVKGMFADGTTLKPEPLFDHMKNQQPDRYLKAYSRDFFYLSARQ